MTHFKPAPLAAQLNPNPPLVARNNLNVAPIPHGQQQQVLGVTHTESSEDNEDVVVDKENANHPPAITGVTEVQTAHSIYALVITPGVLLNAESPQAIQLLLTKFSDIMRDKLPPEPPPLHLDPYKDHAFVKILHGIQPFLHNFVANRTAGRKPFNNVYDQHMPHSYASKTMNKAAEFYLEHAHITDEEGLENTTHFTEVPRFMMLTALTPKDIELCPKPETLHAFGNFIREDIPPEPPPYPMNNSKRVFLKTG